MENYDEGLDYGGVVFEPKSSIYEDQYVIVAVLKFWYQSEKREGTNSEKGGVTFEAPYGNEIRLALPIVDNPTAELPENCITTEQLKLALAAAISTVKKEIN